MFLGFFLLTLAVLVALANYTEQTGFARSLGLPPRTPGWFIVLKVLLLLALVPSGLTLIFS